MNPEAEAERLKADLAFARQMASDSASVVTRLRAALENAERDWDEMNKERLAAVHAKFELKAALVAATQKQRARDAEIVGAYAEQICEPWQYLRARELQKAILADAKPEGATWNP